MKVIKQFLIWILILIVTVFLLLAPLFFIAKKGDRLIKVNTTISTAFDSAIELYVPQDDHLNKQETTYFNHYMKKMSCLFASRDNACKLYDWSSNKENDLRFLNNAPVQQQVKINNQLGILLEKVILAYQNYNGYYDFRQGQLYWAWEKVINQDSSSKLYQKLRKKENPQILLNSLTVKKNFNDSFQMVKTKNEYFFTKYADFKIELSSVAKSFAISNYLQKLTKKNFIINGGASTIYVQGKNFFEIPTIGIKDPLEYLTQSKQGLTGDFAIKSLLQIDLTNFGLATTSTYEQQSSTIINGNRYHHIINLESKKPSLHIYSVTVLDHDLVIADILTTTLASVSLTKAKTIIEKEKLKVIIIYDDKGLKKYLSPWVIKYVE